MRGRGPWRALAALLVCLAACTSLSVGPAAAAPAGVPAAAGGYRVAAGDTLPSVAASTGVPWQTIARHNRIRSPYEIRVGQVLRLSPFAPASLVRNRAAAITRKPTPAPPPAPPDPAPAAPDFAAEVPARTTQVVRTIRSTAYCSSAWCTVTQAWTKDGAGRWRQVKQVRSTIGPNGFGKTRAGDGRSPTGVFAVPLVFSTTSTSPTARMPWRQRKATSTVTGRSGYYYNTWIEEAGRTDGNRSSMRYGFLVDYNNIRVTPGSGPAPVQGKGSGIFYHTSTIGGTRWKATDGCTMLGRAEDMKWFVQWLDAGASPRVVQDL